MGGPLLLSLLLLTNSLLLLLRSCCCRCCCCFYLNGQAGGLCSAGVAPCVAWHAKWRRCPGPSCCLPHLPTWPASAWPAVSTACC